MQHGTALCACGGCRLHHHIRIAAVGDGHHQLITGIAHTFLLLYRQIRLHVCAAGDEILHGGSPAHAAQMQAYGDTAARPVDVHSVHQLPHQHVLDLRRHHGEQHRFLRGVVAGGTAAQRREYHRCAEGPIEIQKVLAAHHPIGDGNDVVQSLIHPVTPVNTAR